MKALKCIVRIVCLSPELQETMCGRFTSKNIYYIKYETTQDCNPDYEQRFAGR